ncbi:SRR1-like protein isoform X1 [Microplitis mediator]|uniref:SRR1-like protein isoform X1 n=1 Tax=Microplitis mediator TaxID=375433 RepID=UPI002553FE5A|nr:SRR1-like protein isoform X1 [Microplitis mediator]
MPGLDEFQVVRRRRSQRNRQVIPLPLGVILYPPEINTEHLLRSMLDAVIVLRKSPYRQILFDCLSKSLSILDRDPIQEIVCYGLGNFSQSRSSKHQLAALLTIKSRYQCPVYLYDPVFYPEEIEVLELLGLSIIPVNEHAQRKVNNDTLTLFYMPHVYKGLIANCVNANWGLNLNNCIFFTNSFESIKNDLGNGPRNRGIANHYQIASELIEKVSVCVDEISLKLSNTDQYCMADAFNSTSIHVFKNSRLTDVPDDFWVPIYSENYRFDENPAAGH